MAAAKPQQLTPHFKWAQDMDKLFISLKVPDVKVSDTKLNVEAERLSFSYQNYTLSFQFRFPVNVVGQVPLHAARPLSDHREGHVERVLAAPDGQERQKEVQTPMSDRLGPLFGRGGR